jgi:hypothetical protein
MTGSLLRIKANDISGVVDMGRMQEMESRKESKKQTSFPGQTIAVSLFKYVAPS